MLLIEYTVHTYLQLHIHTIRPKALFYLQTIPSNMKKRQTLYQQKSSHNHHLP